MGHQKNLNMKVIGINSRLDSIQASILNEKLKRIDLINNKRRIIAKYYFKNLKNRKIYLFRK